MTGRQSTSTRLAPDRRARGRRRLAAAALAVAAASAMLPVASSGTEAAWGDSEFGRSTTLTAGTVNGVTVMNCTSFGLLQPVTYSWTAPAGGLTRTGYRWTVTGGLTGSGTLPATATSVTLSTGLLGLGSGTFSLYTVGPGGWESATVKTGSLSFVTVVLDVISSCSVP